MGEGVSGRGSERKGVRGMKGGGRGVNGRGE